MDTGAWQAAVHGVAESDMTKHIQAKTIWTAREMHVIHWQGGWAVITGKNLLEISKHGIPSLAMTFQSY